ncbi:MAG: alpha/beta hydrolase [Pyrinomonas sp.]|uniref:YheT family hydrolase n=1 Tax=Pyrinomonas sp. TaxID=2080306 RepID=UPI003332658B
MNDRVVRAPFATESLALDMEAIARQLNARPFKPHPLFRSAHAQTLAAFLWPRRFLFRAAQYDEARTFEVEPDVRLLARCRWQESRRERATVILVHGFEGSASSVYILGTADKAFRAGFNVVRLNMRTCGGTEHLTPTLYHSGLIRDFDSVIGQLVEQDRLRALLLVGFSMSGNMTLRLVAEYGAARRPELVGAVAVSPSLDLNACADAIERRENRIYQRSFLRSLRRRMRRKHRLHPDTYDLAPLRRVRTIRDFDEFFTTKYGGYRSVSEYYAATSAKEHLAHIRRPTLIIQAQDDPLIPFASFPHETIARNPYIIMLAPQNGGHVGFLAKSTVGEDRWWAENRAVEFCRLIAHDGLLTH